MYCLTSMLIFFYPFKKEIAENIANASKKNVGVQTDFKKNRKLKIYQLTITSLFESKTSMSYNIPKAMNITNLIAKMLTQDQLPFHHVEKKV